MKTGEETEKAKNQWAKRGQKIGNPAEQTFQRKRRIDLAQSKRGGSLYKKSKKKKEDDHQNPA